MRTLSSWEQYLATADESGVQLHQYATAAIRADVAAARSGWPWSTDYPWGGG